MGEEEPGWERARVKARTFDACCVEIVELQGEVGEMRKWQEQHMTGEFSPHHVIAAEMANQNRKLFWILTTNVTSLFGMVAGLMYILFSHLLSDGQPPDVVEKTVTTLLRMAGLH